jgi:hypothetical protein
VGQAHARMGVKIRLFARWPHLYAIQRRLACGCKFQMAVWGDATDRKPETTPTPHGKASKSAEFMMELRIDAHYSLCPGLAVPFLFE